MRVAITGMGAVSPIGLTVGELVDGLLGGACGIRRAPWLEEGSSASQFYAGVSDRFDPSLRLDDKLIAGSDPFTWFSVDGSDQAIDDAGLRGALDPLRTAIVHGTSMGGLFSLMQAQRALEHGGVSAVSGKTMIKIWPNMACAQIAMRHDLHGPSLTVTTACASSLDALGTAANMIRAGSADVAIVGGTEGGYPAGSHLEPGFLPATAAAEQGYGMRSGGDDPRRALLPFSADRAGIVPGEGSAWFVLESEEHARGRGARVWAWLRGYGSCADGYHPSSPEPSGRWERRAMELAQADAGVSPRDVDVLVAHATGTPKGDTAEIAALNALFVEGAGHDGLVVTALKGHTGHTGASAGAMGVMTVIHAMHHGRLAFANGAADRVDPEIRFDFVTEAPRAVDVEVAQVNAFGFGGQDASVVLSREV